MNLNRRERKAAREWIYHLQERDYSCLTQALRAIMGSKFRYYESDSTLPIACVAFANRISSEDIYDMEDCHLEQKQGHIDLLVLPHDRFHPERGLLYRPVEQSALNLENKLPLCATVVSHNHGEKILEFEPGVAGFLELLNPQIRLACTPIRVYLNAQNYFSRHCCSISDLAPKSIQRGIEGIIEEFKPEILVLGRQYEARD